MAEKKFYVDINFNGNEMKNVIVEQASGNLGDASNSQGKFVYQTDDNFLYYSDGTNWQKIGTANTSGIIGPAEDTDYTDGLFTDFTVNTPVGTPIDRYNELFASLVPKFPSVLSTYGFGTVDGVSLKLGWDTNNVPTGYTTPPGTSIGDTWSVDTGNKQLGVLRATETISGRLNEDQLASTQTPTPAFAADTFSNAQSGLLQMTLNGGTAGNAGSIDLASETASNDCLTVSAAVPVYFAGGDPLLAVDTRVRTGTFSLPLNHTEVRPGYNTCIINHGSEVLAEFSFILDDNTIASPDISSPVNSSISGTGSKTLSGVEYYTNFGWTTTGTLSNGYNVTYPIGNCITCTGDRVATVQQSLSVPSAYNSTFGISQALSPSVNILANISGFNHDVTPNLSFTSPFHANPSENAPVISNILMDKVTASATLSVAVNSLNTENFSGETQRLVEDGSGAFTSANNISATTDLQVACGHLLYPLVDFSTQTNGPSGNPNYSTATNNIRSYTRKFRRTSGTSGSLELYINGTGLTIVDADSLSTSTQNQMSVEIKGLGSTNTGWMDLNKAFASGQYGDGDGCNDGSVGQLNISGNVVGVTLGIRLAQEILVRVKMSKTSTNSNYISSVGCTFK